MPYRSTRRRKSGRLRGKHFKATPLKIVGQTNLDLYDDVVYTHGTSSGDVNSVLNRPFKVDKSTKDTIVVDAWGFPTLARFSPESSTETIPADTTTDWKLLQAPYSIRGFSGNFTWRMSGIKADADNMPSVEIALWRIPRGETFEASKSGAENPPASQLRGTGFTCMGRMRCYPLGFVPANQHFLMDCPFSMKARGIIGPNQRLVLVADHEEMIESNSDSDRSMVLWGTLQRAYLRARKLPDPTF